MPTLMKTLWQEVQELSYNGYRFPNTTRTDGLRITPVYDSAGRAVNYNEWSLSVTWYVAGLLTTDPEFNDLYERLTHPARPLRYFGRGFGNPQVNIASYKDVKWGPKPGPVVGHVVGAGRALRLSWSVSFALPNCANGKHELAPLEVNYSVSHSKDKFGFVDRVMTGHIAVAMTRPLNGGNLQDSADHYRRNVVPPKIKGFHRSFGPWVLSEDRTRLDFEVRDEELRGEQLPLNVVEASFSDGVSSTQMGLRHWQGSMSGSYRMRKGASGIDAAKAFFGSIKARLEDVKKQLQQTPGESTAEVIPTGFSASNPDRYGPPAADFSLTYTFTLSFKNLMRVAGLWRPIYGSPTWEAWVQSLTPHCTDPYAYSNVRFDPSTDRIASLCGPTQSVLTTTDVPVPDFPPNLPQQYTNELVGSATLYDQLEKTFKKPSPQHSWIHYECSIWVETDDGCIPVRTLPAAKLTGTKDILGAQADCLGAAIDAMIRPSLPGSPSKFEGNPVAQAVQTVAKTLRRTDPEMYIFLRGSAIRAGFEIEPPRLIDVGGVKPIPAKRLDAGEGYAKGVKANGYAPLHFAQWNLRYYLPETPSIIRAPQVPNEGFGGA